MNEKVSTPQVQSMENPVWKSENPAIEKQAGKKFMSKKILIVLGGAFLFLLLTFLTDYLQRKQNLTVEEKSVSSKLISPSPAPTLVIDEKTRDLKEGINEAKRDLESLNFFDESFHPPAVDKSIRI